MAVDAQYDDAEIDVNPAQALTEILKSPDKLKDLDLDAFADELQRQGFGNKSITLYDIRAELNHRYKDLRASYRPPTKEDIFNMLTKETPQTFNVGKLVQGRVVGIQYRKPRPDQLEEKTPSRDNVTGLFQCPFCLRADFTEAAQIWTHYDDKYCPGQAVGVRVRLENGIMGFIPMKYISDKRVENPEERVVAIPMHVSGSCVCDYLERARGFTARPVVPTNDNYSPKLYGVLKVDMPLYCRVLKVDIDRFTAELSSRTSDLIDSENNFMPPKDMHYDREIEAEEKKEDEKKMELMTAKGTKYINRVIAHPLFHNITYNESVKALESAEQGDIIIRPSSKGCDHLTLTWKVTDTICQHVDIKEVGKPNNFSLGRSLFINDEEFEDLDEIVARYIQPMAGHARDILGFKYYVDSSGGERKFIEDHLHNEHKHNMSKIPYCISSNKEYPGKFMLSYLPPKSGSVRHEFVTITRDGFRYRRQMFDSFVKLLKWFKEHFREPIPGLATPRAAHTPSAYTAADSHSSAIMTPIQPSGYGAAQATPSDQLMAAAAMWMGSRGGAGTPGGGHLGFQGANTPRSYAAGGAAMTPNHMGNTPGRGGAPPGSMTPGRMPPEWANLANQPQTQAVMAMMAAAAASAANTPLHPGRGTPRSQPGPPGGGGTNPYQPSPAHSHQSHRTPGVATTPRQ